jgi:hypothetical protein
MQAFLLIFLSALCLSSDGTSNRNIKYEARHITLKAPTYSPDPSAPTEAFATRLVEVNHALDHTAQTQYEGWDIINNKIIDTYTNSPLGHRDALEGVTYVHNDLYRKGVSYHADHASDVRLAARKFKERKQAVIEGDLGRQKIEEMSEEDVETMLWGALQEIHDDPDGLDPKYPFLSFVQCTGLTTFEVHCLPIFVLMLWMPWPLTLGPKNSTCCLPNVEDFSLA